mmetsp:Transcript_85119/g.237515  ORF Transcript_85119/g.237515 Transcript_85119/m.237515 type:complete len:250 (+) Transcript_85119:1436-2185(+)
MLFSATARSSSLERKPELSSSNLLKSSFKRAFVAADTFAFALTCVFVLSRARSKRLDVDRTRVKDSWPAQGTFLALESAWSRKLGNELSKLEPCTSTFRSLRGAAEEHAGLTWPGKLGACLGDSSQRAAASENDALRLASSACVGCVSCSERRKAASRRADEAAIPDSEPSSNEPQMCWKSPRSKKTHGPLGVESFWCVGSISDIGYEQPPTLTWARRTAPVLCQLPAAAPPPRLTGALAMPPLRVPTP